MSLRVLQVVTDNDRRGAQLFGVHLEAALRARGHAVETVAMVPGADGGLGLPVLGRRWPSPALVVRLARRMRSVEVTVAHGSDTGLACALASLGRRRYVYRQISDTAFWTPTRARRARSRFGMQRARAVVALSSFNRAQLVDVIGVSAERIVVVPNAVPGAEFAPVGPEGRAAARAALALPDRPTVLAAGALVPEKGVDRAIAAVAALPDAQLVVAGSGPDATDLAVQARAAAPGRVHFLGSRADLVAAYHAADVLVLPSRGGDAMPAVLLEAGLCGLPVVATRLGAIPEVVVDGVTGLVVDPDDDAAIRAALARLLGDAAAREAMGGAARTRGLARYEIGPVAAQWEAVLTRVVTHR